jgi:hypothetical protein
MLSTDDGRNQLLTLCTFLGQNGETLEDVRHFYKAKFIRQWISTKAAKTMVFTKLWPPNNKTSNDYVRYTTTAKPVSGRCD